jgi:hypothetical protein
MFLRPLPKVISRSEYKMVMSRVLSKESNKIIESSEVTGCRQQNPVAVTNPSKLAATITLQVLNQIHVRKWKCPVV